MLERMAYSLGGAFGRAVESLDCYFGGQRRFDAKMARQLEQQAREDMLEVLARFEAEACLYGQIIEASRQIHGDR